jgi:hypothetical protein
MITMLIPVNGVDWAKDILTQQMNYIGTSSATKLIIQNVLNAIPNDIPKNGLIVHAGHDVLRMTESIDDNNGESFALMDDKFHLMHMMKP